LQDFSGVVSFFARWGVTTTWPGGETVTIRHFPHHAVNPIAALGGTMGATAVIWKTLLIAERTFRKLNAPHLMPAELAGQQFTNGKAVRTGAA
jgi:hypothetical protein